MNRRITFQYPKKSKNSFGEDIITWTILATVCAAVEPTTGNERYLQQERVALTDCRFHIRYRLDITSDKQILYRNRVYDILSVISPDDANKELIIFAQEVI